MERTSAIPPAKQETLPVCHIFPLIVELMQTLDCDLAFALLALVGVANLWAAPRVTLAAAVLIG